MVVKKATSVRRQLHKDGGERSLNGIQSAGTESDCTVFLAVHPTLLNQSSATTDEDTTSDAAMLEASPVYWQD